MNLESVRIELFDGAKHSIREITRLLHESYAIHLNNGLNFWAATQTDDYTLQRFQKGIGFVAQIGEEIVGTITYYDTCIDNECEWYKGTNVGRFGQFAVKSSLQKIGLGKLLINEAEKLALSHQKDELSLDTSEKATGLIEYYKKRGFRQIGFMQWHGVNYRSVILSKNIGGRIYE